MCEKMLLYVLMWSFLLKCLLATVFASPSPRIIGGDPAYVGQFPFAAAIYSKKTDGSYFCGGALVAQQWVLTAAHCANDAQSFTIQLGSTWLEGTDPDREVLATNEYEVHPDFDEATSANDLALIRLRVPVTYTAYIQPINIPSVSLLNDTTVTVLGWGQVSDYEANLSNILQYVNVSVLSNIECKTVYGNVITDTMVCVEGNFNEGTCLGDTGGAMVEYLHRSYWIVGIASFISGNGCESTDPSGFTRTFPYTTWIRSVAGL